LRAADQSRWQLSARPEMNGVIARRSRDKQQLDSMKRHARAAHG
jgi:hypothetical protein